MSLVLLVLSLGALFLGPLASRVAHRRGWGEAAMDAFVAVALGGIVLFHILPMALAAGGGGALVAAAVGLLLPHLAHRWWEARGGDAFSGIVGLAFAGLAVHAFLDGAALVAPDGHLHGSGLLLAFSVLLHRVPMALALWWFVHPARGTRAALALLATMAVGTAAGYAVAAASPVDLGSPWTAGFQAFVAGMLLHVVSGHRGEAVRPPSGASRFASLVGVVAGAGVVHLLTRLDPTGSLAGRGAGPGRTFVDLALTVAPTLGAALVLAAGVACLGFPRAPGRRPAGVAAFVAIAAREVRLPALALSLGVLGAGGLARLGAVLAASALAALAATGGARAAPPAAPPRPAFGAAFLAAADASLPWALLAVAAATAAATLGLGPLVALPPLAQAALLVAVAGPLYLRGLGPTPLAVALLAAGGHPGAILALAVAGAALDARPRLERELGRGRGRASAGVAIAAALGLAFVPFELSSTFYVAAPAAPAWLAVAVALVLALLLLLDLGRHGFRGLLEQVFHPCAHDHPEPHRESTIEPAPAVAGATPG